MEPDRNSAVCRHFRNGYCRFGPRCHFRHEWTVIPSSQVCRYFQKGGCWYGEHCRYLHVRQPGIGTVFTGRRGSVPSVVSSMAPPPSERRGSEPSFLRVNVRSRQECSRPGLADNASNFQRAFGHVPDNIAEEQSQGTYLESVQSSDGAEASVYHRKDEEISSSETWEDGAAAASSCKSSGAAAAVVAAAAAAAEEEKTEAFLQSKNVTCGICMEKVYEKENQKKHMFGILPNCNHPFCLECITTWRKTKDLGPDVVRTCPQCRVKSAFYVPNKYWVEGQAKEHVIAAFKKKFCKKRCTFYDRYGCCPFKTDCLYQHVKNTSRPAFSYFSEDEDDELDFLNFFIAMSLLGGEDEDDEDLPFYFTEDYGY